MASTKTRPAEDRFWEKVQITPGCWRWTAAQNKGYGRFQVGTFREPRTVLAHRFSYELTHGPIPEGMTLDHLCRNTWCVWPSHLEPVPLAENTRRASEVRAPITHCKRGHPFTEGSYLLRNGSRHCRECGRIRMSEFHARKKQGAS